MFRAISILALSLSLAACAGHLADLPVVRSTEPLPSPTEPITHPAASQPITLAFEGVAGTLTVTDEHGAVTLLVSLTGLDPSQVYELSVGQMDKGALFDVHNAQVLAGSARDETIFVPDLTGLLRLRAIHPERIVRNSRVLVYLASPAFKPVGQSETITLAAGSP